MDLATFLVELVPSIPPESIRDWAFLVILIPMAARLVFLYEPYQEFRKLFPKDSRKAFSLVRKLRIPGFEKFLRHQLAIVLLPGLIALPILTYSGLDQLTWDNLPSNVTALGSMGLLIWVISEIHRADNVRKKLDSAINDLRGILGVKECRHIILLVDFLTRGSLHFHGNLLNTHIPNSLLCCLHIYISSRSCIRCSRSHRGK